MTTTRRDLLATALTAAGAAAAPQLAGAQESHDHPQPEHQAVPSDPALRTRALESVLVARGLVDRAALDALVDAYEREIGPRNGARVIARDHGVFAFNDSRVQGLGEKPQHLYSVSFAARELWGPAAPANDSVHLDLWDDHLEPA